MRSKPNSARSNRSSASGDKPSGPVEPSKQGDSKEQATSGRTQDGAASRHLTDEEINELEQLTNTLSKENAVLQVKQLKAIQDKLSKNALLVQENINLRQAVVLRDMELSQLEQRLKEQNIAEHSDDEPPRRSTWDSF